MNELAGLLLFPDWLCPFSNVTVRVTSLWATHRALKFFGDLEMFSWVSVQISAYISEVPQVDLKEQSHSDCFSYFLFQIQMLTDAQFSESSFRPTEVYNRCLQGDQSTLLSINYKEHVS